MNTPFRFLIAILLSMILVARAQAHPLLQIQYDRTIAVRLEPEAVHINYMVEMNLLAMTLDGKNLVSPKDIAEQAPDSAYVRAYAARKGPLLVDQLNLWLNKNGTQGRLTFAPIGPAEIYPEPGNTYRLVFKLTAPWLDLNRQAAMLAIGGSALRPMRSLWAPEAGPTHRFEFEDLNFENQPGSVKLTIAERELRGDLEILSSEEPSDLWGKPGHLLNAEEAVRRTRCSAEFTVKSHLNPAAAPEEPAASGQTSEPVSAVRAVWDRGLVALFDTNLGLAVVLLLAVLFGMGHAFTPGHGKTMVAAYLVGERGTPWHAVTLGLTATLSHTGSVILLAVVLYSVYGNSAPLEAQGWLMMAGGLLIFLVGLWLFLQRLRGRADHVHLFQDHHHDHGESEAPARLGWLRVVLLGIGGGIIPCWDAVLLFLLAMAQGRIGLAIPVLLAFSLGLAIVLISLGLAVVYANRKGRGKYGDYRWFKMLPILSAAVLLILGVWFLRDGWHALQNAQQQSQGLK
jgi:ABC-type nickel/cobalt efflux system permease component RcnA